jgi:enediyne biosynthesis protein E4
MQLGLRVFFIYLALFFSGRAFTAVISSVADSTPSAAVQFVDVASTAGLRDRVVNGGEVAKKYIFESTGSGVAVFDYDGDDHADIFLVNGSRLEGFSPSQHPTNHLYHNKGDGAFVDVTAQSGLGHSGWGHGVCAGDYDNDGNTDLFVTVCDLL